MDETTRRRLAEQREHYREQAESFDRRHLGSRANRCHRAKLLRIRRHLRVAPGCRVLEVGVGTGLHGRWLLDLCAVDYVGLDLSPAMLATARLRLGLHVPLVESAAEELPFSDASFDAAYCSGTLHHVADRARAVREMSRVVRPGGRVVISEPNPWNPWNALAWATRRVERGQLYMRPPVLRSYLRRAEIRVDAVELFNFTPPGPAFLAPAFDLVDSVAESLPGLRRIASMVLVAGTVGGSR